MKLMATNVVVLIQSRMGSSRLPNKAMLSLHGHPLIEWVVKRTSSSKLSNQIVVTIPESKADDVLDFYLKEINATVFRGSEQDVLARFYYAAKKHQATHVVRVCADNPFVCGEEIDNLIRYFFASNYDYVYNHIPLNNTYPDGLGAEMISFASLETSFMNATLKEHREHCFSYIKDNPDMFSVSTFNPPNKKIAYPNMKFDIDTWEDYYTLATQNVSIESTSEEIVNVFNRL